MSMTPISMSSRQLYEAISRSPVAMGVVERLAIFAIACTFSGGHGSSTKSRLSGSISLMMIEATLGLAFAWKSTAIINDAFQLRKHRLVVYNENIRSRSRQLAEQDPAQLAFRIVDHATVIVENHCLAAHRIARCPG